MNGRFWPKAAPGLLNSREAAIDPLRPPARFGHLEHVFGAAVENGIEFDFDSYPAVAGVAILDCEEP